MLSLVVTVGAMDNGEARLPPMGWRSWNCFYADIDDAKIRGQIDALVQPRDSAGTSLFSLGYTSIGIDEGWEGCHMGINGTVHYAIDQQQFLQGYLPVVVLHLNHRNGTLPGNSINSGPGFVTTGNVEQVKKLAGVER